MPANGIYRRRREVATEAVVAATVQTDAGLANRSGILNVVSAPEDGGRLDP